MWSMRNMGKAAKQGKKTTLQIRPGLISCLSILVLATGPGTALSQQSHDLVRGQAVYEHWCSHCHAEGRGHPGTQSLQIKYDGSLPAVLTEREDLTPEAIKTFVRQGVLSMAPFRKTEITDEELDDMAAWLTDQ